MRIEKLSKMTKGWFVGNFEPSLYSTNEMEVAVKEYNTGDYESAHYHKVATEITVVVSGVVEMNGSRYEKGDIIILDAGEVTDFRAITDAVNTVVKIPGVNNDKYIVEEEIHA